MWQESTLGAGIQREEKVAIQVVCIVLFLKLLLNLERGRYDGDFIS